MIVKVQAERRRCVIQNRDRTVRYEGALQPEVARLLRGRPKAYFQADVNDAGAIVFGQDSEVSRNW